MVSERQTIAARMAALYAQIPAVHCKGECTASCSASVFVMRAMSTFEFSRATFGGTKFIPIVDLDEPCVFLQRGRCQVYNARPMICRLWGAVDHPQMRCPFGCEPDRWLTDDEGRALLDAAAEVGGGMA